ncbi:MAG: hypothetical protein JOY90_04810 [Bradyrhizobium sp.]|nr:hypothetical protein [Bradyrhizobium sp.]
MQMTLGVLAGAVARVEECCRGRIATAERTILAHIDPEPFGRGMPLGEHRHRRLVAMRVLAGEHVRMDQIVRRSQQRGTTADLNGGKPVRVLQINGGPDGVQIAQRN